MELSEVLASVLQNLDLTGWKPLIEDDYPDFKHVVCRKSPGFLEAFTRLDVLVMTPELKPSDATGICLCFLFYADPDKVADMRRFGKLIRQGNFLILRQECATVLHGSMFQLLSPAITIKTRPRFEKIRFDNNRYDYPAFFVELGYWMPAKESREATE